MTEVEYKTLLRPHIRAVRQLLADLDFFREDIGPINVFSISSRLKSYGSAIRKSQQISIPVQNLQDLAGIRIVVATSREVEVLASFFRRGKESGDLEIESDKPLSKESGYRARHIVVVMKPYYTRSMHPARIEIQLMTILQQAFNFMSRAWVYKSDSQMSAKWQSNFSDFAKDLRRVDRLADRLHSEGLKSASTLDDAAVLTPMSYQQLVKKVFGEDISLDEAVDSCRFMVDLSCRTNGAVRIFFEDNRIEQLRKKCQCATGKAAWLRSLTNETKHMFWLLFGTRYDAIAKLLDEKDQLPPALPQSGH